MIERQQIESALSWVGDKHVDNIDVIHMLNESVGGCGYPDWWEDFRNCLPNVGRVHEKYHVIDRLKLIRLVRRRQW